MEQVQQQVAQAQRRLSLALFGSRVIPALVIGLSLAVLGLALPKVWYLEFLDTPAAHRLWLYGWLGAGLGGGLLLALLLTWRSAPSRMKASLELDRRFGLRERISSALSLSADQAETEAGRALLADAAYQAEGIDVRDRFPLRPRRQALFPLIPATLIAGLLFLPDRTAPEPVVSDAPPFNRQQVQLQVEAVKKKVEQQRQQLEAKGLEDASRELKSLGQEFDKLLDDPPEDRQQTLVQINNIKQQIEKRQQELGDSKSLKESLNQLGNAASGPAQKMAEALKEGDLKKAREAAQELADKMRNGEMSAAEAAQLAEDLQRLAQAVEQNAQRRQQEQERLQQQIDQAVQQGNLEKAARLQQQLNEARQLDGAMQQLQQMAQQLQQAGECLQPGQEGQAPNDGQPGMQQAAEAMQQALEQLRQLEGQMAEMEALEGLQQMAEGVKESCQNPGEGEPGQGGAGPPQEGPPQWQDWAQGQGNGGGKRDIEANDTGEFKGRVRADVGQGETITTNNADGQNISGRSVSQTRELVRASMDQDVDPLENQKLSRKQREHAQQYFEALRRNQ